MGQELKKNGKISDSTNQEYEKAVQSWDGIFKSFSSQLKTFNPFTRTFNSKKWQKIFDTAFSPKDSELLEKWSLP